MSKKHKNLTDKFNASVVRGTLKGVKTFSRIPSTSKSGFGVKKTVTYPYAVSHNRVARLMLLM